METLGITGNHSFNVLKESILKQKVMEVEQQLARVQTPNTTPSIAEKPVIWFAPAEAQFQISAITQDGTKYGHILSVLEALVAEEVEDVIGNPQAEGNLGNIPERQLKLYWEGLGLEEASWDRYADTVISLAALKLATYVMASSVSYIPTAKYAYI
ncbi:unnamed protein product [Leptidea sinapis]|uniref:DUF7041 domain-containing protein n=1 Tax=Leptidea sinapis TaxID=189913 RepID=A0A5E4PYP5_9NEOP|nr:unnamed protein product [Leptidea sinapis]